jgi:peptidoglycan/xylan/chitin deacetylase (PgdA/CDA1 family)/sulfur carrier protein ThiS
MARVALIALIGLATAAVASAAGYHWLRAESITVSVRGLEERVHEGTTLTEGAERFGLRPAAGDLLDVKQVVLRWDAFPGTLLVNGKAVPPTTKLEEGDRLGVLDGRDRREPVTRFFIRVRVGMPANPQFSLARTPGRQEFERGRISRKVALAAFHPTGPSRVPKAVALTFDDGPSRYTPRVLSILARLHARATFFLIGELAERNPRFVRREIAAGMGVGSHSYSHPYSPPFDRQPHERILSEIERGKDVLTSLGRTPTVFRPPGGSFSSYLIEATGAYSQRIVLWSVDPEDWREGTTAKQITKRVLGAVRPGSIVLLHDGGGDQSPTVKALPTIVKGIRAKGLRLALVR